MARADDMDDLVSSVRDFISHKEPPRRRSRILLERLVLRPDQRIDVPVKHEKIVNAASATVAGDLPLPSVKRFENAGLAATIAELEAAVAMQFGRFDEDDNIGSATSTPVAHDSATNPEQTSKPRSRGNSAPHLSMVYDAQMTQAADRAADRTADRQEPAIIERDVANTSAGSTASAAPGVDEDQLRQLIVQVLHQELSGALGEQITRNVRKMVRREINHVLTSRDMGAGIK